MKFLKSNIAIWVELIIFSSLSLYCFGQEKPKTDITIGYHSVFTNLAPTKIFKPRSLDNGGHTFCLQWNRTYFVSSNENPLIKLKYGLGSYFRTSEFGIPVLSAMNTVQFDLMRKNPDALTVGLETNVQFGKWLIKKKPTDRYSLVFFSFYGAFRPNKYFKNLRLRYRYDLTPFYYYYFPLQDVNTSFTYQRGFSLEYTFGQKELAQ